MKNILQKIKQVLDVKNPEKSNVTIKKLEVKDPVSKTPKVTEDKKPVDVKNPEEVKVSTKKTEVDVSKKNTVEKPKVSAKVETGANPEEVKLANKKDKSTSGKNPSLSFKTVFDNDELAKKVKAVIDKGNVKALTTLMKDFGLTSDSTISLDNTAISILAYAELMGKDEIKDWLAKDVHSTSRSEYKGGELENAILSANCDLLQNLLLSGANPNEGDGILLVLAVKKNLFSAVEILVGHGAKITKKNSQELYDLAHRNNNYDLMRFIAGRVI